LYARVRLRGLPRGNLLELLAEVLNLVGVILGDFAPEGALDVVERRVGRDLEKLVEPFGHEKRCLLLELGDVGGGRSSRIWRCSRSFFARLPGDAVSAFFAQYGQNFHPVCSGRWQCGHPPPTRWPHDGHAAKSGETLAPHSGQAARLRALP